MVLDRLGERLCSRPVFFLEGRLASAPPPAFPRELLPEKAAGAPSPGTPARLARAIVPRNRELDEGRELLGLPEISVCRFREALALERNDALVALGIAAAINGHGEMAIAKEPAVGRKLGKPYGGDAGTAGQPAQPWRGGDGELNRRAGGVWGSELPPILGGGAERPREPARPAEKLRDRFWIIVAREDGVHRRPKFHEPAEN